MRRPLCGRRQLPERLAPHERWEDYNMKKVMPLAAMMTAALMGSTAINAAEVEVIH